MTLFKGKKVIIKNAKYLDTKGEFIPDKILHREEQIKEFTKWLTPAFLGRKPESIHIYGSVGTGKTITTKYVLSQLEKESKEKVRYFYVSPRYDIADTQYKIYRHFISEYFKKDLPRRGWSSYDIKEEFSKLIENLSDVLIIVIDDVDILDINNLAALLYTFSRANLETPQISIITISNSFSYYARLDRATSSSFNPVSIIFPQYDASEIEEILYYISSKALIPNCCDAIVINKISALSAQKEGDCRYAVDLLRVSSLLAEAENSNRVTEKYVNAAIEEVEKEQTERLVKGLSIQSRLVLKAISETSIKGLSTSGVIYRKYKSYGVLSTLSYHSVSTIIKNLNSIGLITTNLKRGGRGGTTTYIELNISREDINNYLIDLE